MEPVKELKSHTGAGFILSTGRVSPVHGNGGIRYVKRHIPYKVKSKAGVEYTKYRKQYIRADLVRQMDADQKVLEDFDRAETSPDGRTLKVPGHE